MTLKALQLYLFGHFRVYSEDREVTGLEGRKVQELFCYLLFHRNHFQAREHLASLLWDSDSDARARGYLRKALWQLQTSLADKAMPAEGHMLEVDAECIKLTPTTQCWLDIDVFEQAYDSVKSIPGKDLDAEQAHTLEDAARLYAGDLLEGWDQHWCLCERERYHYMYLAIMDKLLDYCEAREAYERGIDFGMQILHFDRVHERTYQKLMRLHYLSGDRTSALREYEHCAEALIDELGVQPGQQTKALYQQIVDSALNNGNLSQPKRQETAPNADLARVLDRLQALQAAVDDLHGQVRREIGVLEDVLLTGHPH